MISDAQLRRLLPASAVDLLGDLIRWGTWAGVGVIWVSFVRAYVKLWWRTATEPGKNDYSIFYVTARIIRDGLPMYGPVPAEYGIQWPAQSLGNLNPPHFALLTLPLSLLGYAQAFVLWLVGGLACLLCSVRIIWRELGYPRSWKVALALGAAILSFAPFVSVASTGELTYFLLLPFTLAWRAARRGRWTAAGAWLGACASVKLFLLLFLPWLLLQRRWKGAAAFVGAAIAAVGVGVIAFGVEPYRQWQQTVAMIEWWGLPMNASFTGLVHRAWPSGGRTARLVAATGAVVMCAASLWWFRRPASRPEDTDVAMTGMLLACLLASPLGWGYYVPLALGPMLGYGRALWRAHAGHRWWAATAMAAAILCVPDEVIGAWSGAGWQAATLGSLYFWALLALWLCQVSWMNGGRASASETPDDVTYSLDQPAEQPFG